MGHLNIQQATAVKLIGSTSFRNKLMKTPRC